MAIKKTSVEEKRKCGRRKSDFAVRCMLGVSLVVNIALVSVVIASCGNMLIGDGPQKSSSRGPAANPAIQIYFNGNTAVNMSGGIISWWEFRDLYGTGGISLSAGLSGAAAGDEIIWRFTPDSMVPAGVDMVKWDTASQALAATPWKPGDAARHFDMAAHNTGVGSVTVTAALKRDLRIYSAFRIDHCPVVPGFTTVPSTFSGGTIATPTVYEGKAKVTFYDFDVDRWGGSPPTRNLTTHLAIDPANTSQTLEVYINTRGEMEYDPVIDRTPAKKAALTTLFGAKWVGSLTVYPTASGTTYLIGREPRLGSDYKKPIVLNLGTTGGLGSRPFVSNYRVNGVTSYIPRGSYAELALGGNAQLEADLDMMNEPWTGSTYGNTFNGDGHKLYNLTSSTGLFGNLIAGSAIANIHIASGHVTGTSNLGAFTGQNSGKIIACSNDAEVAGSGLSGGIAGVNGGTIVACYNTGTVSGGTVGGIAGGNSSTIVACYNKGSVSGGTVGGIAGNNTSGTITDCWYKWWGWGARGIGGAPGDTVGQIDSFTGSTFSPPTGPNLGWNIGTFLYNAAPANGVYWKNHNGGGGGLPQLWWE